MKYTMGDRNPAECRRPFTKTVFSVTVYSVINNIQQIIKSLLGKKMKILIIHLNNTNSLSFSNTCLDVLNALKNAN